MVSDVQALTGLIERHKTIRANYHFLNEELFEMEACERDIKAILKKYDNNMPGLISLVKSIPSVTKFISKEKLEEMEASMKQPEQTTKQFYSLDGKIYATLEEAMARNEELTKPKEFDTLEEAMANSETPSKKTM